MKIDYKNCNKQHLDLLEKFCNKKIKYWREMESNPSRGKESRKMISNFLDDLEQIFLAR